jgi:hypothetical protein
MSWRMLLLLVALAGLGPAWAQPLPAPTPPPAADETPPEPPVLVTGLRVEIIDRGIYTTVSGATRIMPNGIGEATVEELQLEHSTTAIPARPGISFGFEFTVHGRPPGTLVELTATVIFPPPGLTPPGRSAPVASSGSPMVVVIGEGAVTYRGYTFDYEWETVPGVWRFEVRIGDRLLAVQSFTVTNES